MNKKHRPKTSQQIVINTGETVKTVVDTSQAAIIRKRAMDAAEEKREREANKEVWKEVWDE